MLQYLTDDGDWQTIYTTENGSYQGMLLGIKRPGEGNDRFPMYDNIGTVLGLVSDEGTVTDSYELDKCGTPRPGRRPMGSAAGQSGPVHRARPGREELAHM